MVRLITFVLVTSLASSAGAQNGGSRPTESSDSAITLRQRVGQFCDLLQKGTLLPEEGYVAVSVEGVAGEIYSPELGKDDIVGYSTNTPEQLLKLAQKSGFRMKPVAATEVSNLPKVVGRENDSACPGLEQALQTAEQGRIDRRRQLQSKVFRAGSGAVSPPEALDTPQPKAEPEGASSSPQSSHRAAASAHVKQGKIVVSAVVASNGALEQVRVVHSVSPEVDLQAIQTASKWKFKPGKKNGLPVPVLINVEVNFSLY